MTSRARDLVGRADLGLPYQSKQVFRRALMHLPWRMFVGRQVEFNRATAEAVDGLAEAVRRLEKRLDKLARAQQEDAATHRESGAVAVREQLYDTEGALRRDLSALQLEIARLAQENRGS
ncbi:hypothetical protein [Nocardioides nitrophenolicus]|uniref:hypothetical protein n=1 Tax=Nocardioides nitrophenolicus TaxID=60489 RepID=UPI00195D6BF3|nr:hypothetical protein [Nocardioides nitrophenolicus]MBM7519390.1 hypothetical protein [Nocardioides nitrophenolicus]